MLDLFDTSPEYTAHLCPGPYKVVGNRKYLTGNTNEILISTYLYSSNKKRLLIFGDSFFKDLVPFLQPYFSDLMYVRSQNVHKDIIDSYMPDIVFTGNAERYLSNVRSDDLAPNILLDLYSDKKCRPDDDFLDAFKAQLSYAYYNHNYINYKKKLCLLHEPSKNIEIASWNNQLVKIEEKEEKSLSLESIGNDPIIYFRDIYFDISKIYEIDIVISSDTESFLQLFFTTLFDCKFSEKKSFRRKISIGVNNIKIKIDAQYLGRKLRLDPLNSVGIIKIHSITIASITAN